MHETLKRGKLIGWIVFFSQTGDTANVPDSVMGLTFLAAGTSLPEAVSSVIVTNQGHGAMGISSSISSNTFDILLCLGIPWFLKSYYVPDVPGENWVSPPFLLISSSLRINVLSWKSFYYRLHCIQLELIIQRCHCCPHWSACMWHSHLTNSNWIGKLVPLVWSCTSRFWDWRVWLN